MKYLILFLVSTSVFADVWEPLEKDLAILEWKAEHTPENVLAKKYSKIENMDYVREFSDCVLDGITKIENLETSSQQPCVSL